MKKIYITFLIIGFTVLGLNANAQCTGCTTNITGLDVANHLVLSGQTLCVSPTGTLTGLITVSAGGTLCNQGKINSTNVLISGGTFKNYGTIDTYSVTISSAGSFTNYTTALIDSLWITNSNTSYINNGTQTGTALGVSNHGSVTNNGTITVYDHGDSLATFINNGNITVTNNCAASYTSTCINNGNITVNNDFATSYNSTFTNNNYMKVMRDFYNSTSSVFTTNCMITIGRDWYNSATIYGPAATSCGGFNIAGASYNSGIIGSGTTHIDICDVGHPALGLDGPGGTINGTTTYCNCNNSCVPVATGIQELQSDVFINTIYPNPASHQLTIQLHLKESELLLFEVRDMMGKIICTTSYQASVGENEAVIPVSDLAQGTYILTMTDARQRRSNRLFNVYK
ncbi:MAG: T9SS type A sorting domain-containing protein [Bacteroidetes bacterium]|nr:T9SS type A sorting domain-containing protein [Bacteroidota bacterium]